MPGTVVENMVRSGLEGFMNQEDAAAKKESYIALIASLISFVIALVILSLIGKFLWNGVIVDLFSFAKPARSYMQILGLFVFTSLLL
jgi:hypothetical protein